MKIKNILLFFSKYEKIIQIIESLITDIDAFILQFSDKKAKTALANEIDMLKLALMKILEHLETIFLEILKAKLIKE